VERRKRGGGHQGGGRGSGRVEGRILFYIKVG
jgi:hypothetical protein